MKTGSPEEHWQEDCAPRRVLELFSTKWTSMVLHTLAVRHDGTARSNTLHRSLPAISKKMLIQTLRDMEHAGIVLRTEYPTVPPSVEYTLTPLGRQLVEPVELIYDWARRNAGALDALQPRMTSRRR
ncbi:helix-turn-helix domain-containing protein [Stenotrophomonas sp. SRS1]|uniref:winged helix-turn-helix transcriptional regulator n=1 Tax=Stenotrophomonas sp. SRS1 TaxID=2870345 RepID=UPI002238F72F|nr:helix-turn-helix domain-containing protein [Stenotrophomonas sp. SRS1]